VEALETLQIGGITGGWNGLGAGLRFRATGGPAASADPGPRLALRDFASTVRDLGDALEELRRAGKHRESLGRGRGASAVSAEDLGLGSTPSPAVLRSTEEINAADGEDVDPDGRFDVAGPGGPNFETGVTVGEGAFLVNGQRINVSASASIHDVLASITGSAAGVTATWDSAEERVVLTQKTPGVEGEIDVTGDTSGFVAAVKLAGATLEFGASNDSQKDIAAVPQLAGITNGDFEINGVTFQVDTSRDSLGDLIRSINASEAGVTAYYDTSSGKFSVRAQGRRSLALDDGTSGLFGALGIAAGVYRGSPSGRAVSLVDEGGLRRELRGLAESFGKVFEGQVEGYAVGAAAVIRGSLVKELEAAFDGALDKSGGERLRSGLGVDLGARAGSFRALVLDEAALGRALRRDEAELVDLLFAEQREDGESGLLERLEGVLERAFTQLAGMLAPEEALGLRLDVSG